MYVVKSWGQYLHEGPYEKALEFYCPEFGDLLGARLFESKEQMLAWLKENTNYQPRRLDSEHAGWALVPYVQEAADLITRLVEKMA